MKAVIRLIIIALVIHAVFRTATAAWRHFQFRDGVQQTAQFSGGRSDEDLVQQVNEIAKAYDIPLTPERVSVRRVNNHTLIDASYDARIEILPRYFYPWRFDVNVDAFTIVPKEAAP
jgi:hypothetical protein